MDESTGHSRGYMLMWQDDAETPLRMDGQGDGEAFTSYRLCWGELIKQYLERATTAEQVHNPSLEAGQSHRGGPSLGKGFSSFGEGLHLAMHGDSLANVLKAKPCLSPSPFPFPYVCPRCGVPSRLC